MKTLTIIWLCVSLSLWATAQTAEMPFGAGTKDEPYEIETLDNLYWLSQNPEDWDKHYRQLNNIDASATSDWDNGKGFTPIGTSENKFTGSYNGDFYQIQNLYINRPDDDYIGFFGDVDASTAKLENMALTDVNITGAYKVGALVGYLNAVVNRCYTTGNVQGIEYVGGLAGILFKNVLDSCYSSATVSGDSKTGGLLGDAFDASLYNCYADGNVSVVNSAGGILLGSATYVTIVQCYTTGQLTGGEKLGGLVGVFHNSNVSDSYSLASVNGTSTVGGLLANAKTSCHIDRCYSAGHLTASTGAGGLIASFSEDSQLSDSFWDITSSGQSNSGAGTGKTTAQMKNPDTYTNTTTAGLTDAWDFDGTRNDDMATDDIWLIDENKNNGYPQLAVFVPATTIKSPQQQIPIDLYPNPLNNYLNIKSTKIIETVTISDLSGQKLLSVNSLEQKSIIRLNVSKLKPGIYLITIHTNDKHQFSKKLIKQ